MQLLNIALLVLCCWAGVAHGQAKGAACTDTCDAGLVCQEQKCRVKIDDACTASSTEDCVVTAAACPAGATCACPTDATANADKTVCACDGDKVFKGDKSKCVLKAGLTGCSAGGCLDDATCNSAGTCECDANFVASTDNTKCLKKAEQPCSETAECLTGSTCEGDPKKCTCSYGANAAKTKCRVKIGEACTASSTDECVVTAANCPSSGSAVCGCPAETTSNDAKTECVCNDNKKTLKADKTCGLKAGQTGCSSGGCLDDATCNSGTCECNANFVANADNTKCLKKAGQSCSDDTECLTGAECKGSPKECTCPNGAIDENTKCAGATAVMASLTLLLAALVASLWM